LGDPAARRRVGVEAIADVSALKGVGLHEKLWNEGDPKGVKADLLDRVRGRLTALNEVHDLRELKMPGWGLHRLQGKPTRYARGQRPMAYHL
jgi:hypothetical protein